MEMKIKPRIFMTIFLIMAFSFGAYEAIEFPYANRLFPLLISLTGLVLCIIQLFLDIKNNSKDSRENAEDIVDIGSDFSIPASVVRARALLFLFWYSSLTICIWLVGFKIAIPIFFVSFLRIEGKVSWTVTFILTAVSIYAIFFHFENLLGVYWPDALFKKWINISWLF